METRASITTGRVAWRRDSWLRNVGLSAILAHGCVTDSEIPAAHTPPPPPGITFEEVAATQHLDFVHQSGATGTFLYPEITQGGGAFLDADGDGFLDVYLVQAGPLNARGPERPANRLFRNRGDGTYEDQTDAAGVGDTGYGSGVAAADFDRDGDVDLYVTNLGPNRLYVNRGDGTFDDQTATAGVGDPAWSTSAAFFDVDGDGDLDLWVVNYVEWSLENERPCLGRAGMRSYCNPGEYTPSSDTLYRNDGDGTFTDISGKAGITAHPAAGLGIVTADFDGDGRLNAYIANDQMANQLWLTSGDGTLRDEALLLGAALNERGQAEAGMGVVAEDPDADGDMDLFMVHLSGETNTYYRNEQGGFTDATDELGLGAPSQPYTGFGVGLVDFDGDGWLDAFVANGKVSPGTSVENDFREPNQILRGLPDGTFEDVSKNAGRAMELLEVSRAAVFGDHDNDGDLDVLVVNNDGPVRLYENRARHPGQPSTHHFLTLDLDGGARFGRVPIGTLVRVEAGGRRQHRTVQPAWGYCASHDPRVHFGLGTSEQVDRVWVRWPDGSEETIRDLVADRIVTWSPGSPPPAAPATGGR